MDDREHWSPIDPLGEALHILQMSGSFYCRSELRAPWGMSLPPMPEYMWFHIVIAGTCLIDVAGGEPTLIRAGDLALVPHGAGHRLQSDQCAATPHILALYREQISARYEILRHGGSGAATTMLCAAVRFDHPAARNLIDHLPGVIHVDASRTLQDWLHSTVRLLAAEAGTPRPGGETVITRLADILVIQALRSWIETDPAARRGWLGALRDRQVGRALALIHRDPARDWTVDALARELAMSRSAFAARFNALVGEPPMRYLTRWRMYVALEWLKDRDATVAEIALRLGYGSEAAFSRAFKRITGISPGSVKRSSYGSNLSPAAAAS